MVQLAGQGQDQPDFGEFGGGLQNDKQEGHLTAVRLPRRMCGRDFADGEAYTRTVMARIVFLGTPIFALPALRRLCATEHDVVGVYSQPDRPAGRGRRVREAPVKADAAARGLLVVTPMSFKSEAAVEELAALRPELLVIVAYGKLLPATVLAIPPKGTLNLHPSLLPKYRGPSPIIGAILAGDTETGVTVMVLDEGMDSGPIVAQVREPIRSSDTATTLGERLSEKGAELLVETLGGWLEGTAPAVAQDDAEATYCKLVKKEQGRIDWSKDAGEIARQVRAYDPWPGSYTLWGGLRIAVLEAMVIEGRGGGPGTVFAAEQGALLGVITGEGALGVRRLQPEGKRAMSAREFLAGRAQVIGQRFAS